MKTLLRQILIKFLSCRVSIFGRESENLTFGGVLIIAPHPDDEILGLGGFILKLLDDGRKIHIIYLTDGENSGVWPDKEEIRHQRIAISEKVCNLMGICNSDITRLQ